MENKASKDLRFQPTPPCSPLQGFITFGLMIL